MFYGRELQHESGLGVMLLPRVYAKFNVAGQLN
jgi:hypothetical protein